ncbi:MAG TPA: 30S ribosomal protein S4 [Patescibacteria group bacterium]|jgi:small subunit ribosomal protein S4|nr:30S ribosomal protein S4 [Patescibacteria group bacterium]
MRYTGPKVKKARRLGFAFTEKDARIMQRRPTPPGQHGANRVRISEYGMQLREKQKAKINYGVQEKQFLRYFDKAINRPGVTGDLLLEMLELRLDNIVFRLGFAETRAQSRQLVNHGFFEVNGKRVDIPSFATKPGDTITVRESKKASKYMEARKEKMKGFKSQEWIELNATTFSGKVLSVPTPDQIGNLINTQLIVEHYSRI